MRFIGLFLITSVLLYNFAFGQDTTALKTMLLGRWEVVKYAEQGVQVDKKQAAMPQAQQVYQHIREQRALQYYGYDYNSEERTTRAFERWQEADEMQETRRVEKAIAMPYFAVFFTDSTLAVYNKDTSGVYFPESLHFTFVPKTMSMDIGYAGSFVPRWQAQVLVLTRERMVLFLPEDAEVVELVKADGDMP